MLPLENLPSETSGLIALTPELAQRFGPKEAPVGAARPVKRRLARGSGGSERIHFVAATDEPRLEIVGATRAPPAVVCSDHDHPGTASADCPDPETAPDHLDAGSHDPPPGGSALGYPVGIPRPSVSRH